MTMKQQSRRHLIATLFLVAAAAITRAAFLIYTPIGWLALALASLSFAGWLMGLEDSAGVEATEPSPIEAAYSERALAGRRLNASGPSIHTDA